MPYRRSHFNLLLALVVSASAAHAQQAACLDTSLCPAARAHDTEHVSRAPSECDPEVLRSTVCTSGTDVWFLADSDSRLHLKIDPM